MKGLQSFLVEREENQNHLSNYINIIRLFEHQDEMYYDMCHYTDEGHEVIAGKVYDAIMSMVSELLKLAF